MNQYQSNHKPLQIGTICVSKFLNSEANISLPDFQRPYVWTEEKLEQLFKDFDEHFYQDNKFNPDTPFYYLGTILLFQKSETEYEIIDGQQRISSLLICDHAWNTEKSYLSQNKWNLEYGSLISAAALRQNFHFLKNYHLKGKYISHIKEIFNKLVFTFIITTSEDEAFIFFDSQNNRGVSLSPVDFLKSYHLRELKGKEKLQKVFAKQWDKNNKSQFLNELFNIVLWRNRNWKGKHLYYEYKDAILNSFQKETIKEAENETIQLYPNIFNSLANTLNFDADRGISITPVTLNLKTTAEQYPFAIRQPIQRGVGFFLYTEKYFAVYNLIFKENRFSDFSYLYDTLLKGVSYYLKTFFKLAVVTYYDKYKNYQLMEFGLWLDYLIGSYRIEQHTIVAQTIIKILRDNSQNLLDVIEMSYRPYEVFEFIQSITNDNNYDKEIKNLGTVNGVRNQYRKNNLSFYENQCKNEKVLTNKKSWINEYIANHK